MSRWLKLALCVLAVSITSKGEALDPKTKDPRLIAQAAFDAQTGPKTISRVKMSIKNRNGSRERVMTMRNRRVGEERKTLILIEQPADVRNTGFLSIDHGAKGGSDEQWLYLPKLHRVSRVPSSGKADSFVGSDFTISDLSPQDANNFELKLVEASTKVGDDECWLIEATPRNEKVAAETGYEKSQFWVSKQKLVPLQIKTWVTGGKRTKYFKAADVRQVDGVWTAHRLQMRTLEGTDVVSETLIEVLSVDNDAEEVTDTDFTQQRLERGV